MAFPNGLPATASATALFTLIFQRPVSTAFGPADFLIGGLARTAYLRAVPMPGKLPVPDERAGGRQGKHSYFLTSFSQTLLLEEKKEVVPFL